MNKLLLAFLTGCQTMVNETSDLERLKFMPQRVEDGKILNFNDKCVFGTIRNVEDVEIFNKERVVEATRCTAALKRDYFVEFEKFLVANPVVDGGIEEENVVVTVKEDEQPKEEAVYLELYDAVAKGDKKAVRTICKQLEDKWFALDPDIVEDAIDDIKACVKDKDVEEVKVIISETIEDVEEVIKETPKSDEEVITDTEETLEIIADIEDALKDEDIEDVKMLLKELDPNHQKYKEFEDALKALEKDDVEEDNTTEDEDEDVIDDILNDLDDALKAGELDGEDGAKAILEELKEEVGEDDEDYKKYYALVYPPVEKTTRRKRRGK